jgi:hypothetical protein
MLELIERGKNLLKPKKTAKGPKTEVRHHGLAESGSPRN